MSTTRCLSAKEMVESEGKYANGLGSFSWAAARRVKKGHPVAKFGCDKSHKQWSCRLASRRPCYESVHHDESSLDGVS